ncbi:MAG: hypothetical protein ABSD89_15320, partial [Halobacteriota archaeon]
VCRPWRQTSCSNIQIAASSKQTQLMTGPSFTVGAPCFSRTLVIRLIRQEFPLASNSELDGID